MNPFNSNIKGPIHHTFWIYVALFESLTDSVIKTLNPIPFKIVNLLNRIWVSFDRIQGSFGRIQVSFDGIWNTLSPCHHTLAVRMHMCVCVYVCVCVRVRDCVCVLVCACVWDTLSPHSSSSATAVANMARFWGPHVWMSCRTHLNAQYHTCFTYEWTVTADSEVHTYGWVVAHIWMRNIPHVSHVNEP